MRLTLDITKSVEENASHYFEMAKHARKKAEGAKEALEETKIKLTLLEKEIETKTLEEKEKAGKKERKKDWYEKFRWFFTSDSFLVIAGRDATTNEIIIKKHTDKQDIVFHTEMAGSPFAAFKTDGKEPSKIALEEAAEFVAAYSKAWKLGRTLMEVFYVNPDQVTKEAPSGEYVSKGSFMIYGQKNFFTIPVKLFIGKMEDGKIMSGPLAAVKKHCKEYVELLPGNEKNSTIAKKIKAKLAADDLDDILKLIPPGSKLKE
jgi:predicted ribosome quality control (RQC) complex YloA/Tae2 family protein